MIRPDPASLPWLRFARLMGLELVSYSPSHCILHDANSLIRFSDRDRRELCRLVPPLPSRRRRRRLSTL